MFERERERALILGFTRGKFIAKLQSSIDTLYFMYLLSQPDPRPTSKVMLGGI